MNRVRASYGVVVCCACVALALPAFSEGTASLVTPGNGALLYYQALLIRPEPNDATRRAMNRVLRGEDPDDCARSYLKLRSTANAIALMDAGARAPQCDWGVLHSRGETLDPIVVGALRNLSLLLELDARVLAYSRQYRGALDKCLSMRRLASHLSDGTLMPYECYLLVDLRALKCIRQILGSMPLDLDTLTWLQGHLAVQRTAASTASALELTRDYMAKYLYANPPELRRRRKQFVSAATESGAAEDLLSNLTDQEFLERSLAAYDKFLYAVLRIFGGDMPYEDKYAELDALRRKPTDIIARDDPIIMPIVAEQIATCYTLQVHHAAYLNAVKAALEVYRVVAETGQLPEEPPPFLPSDPFSGSDFVYERADKSFTFRCRSRDIFASEKRYFEPDEPPAIGNTIQSYEFTVAEE